MLSLWMGLGAPVSRRAYLLSGFGLMALKYALEAALIRALIGAPWTPIGFLSPLLASRAAVFEAPGGNPAMWALVLGSLPFMWIAVSMSVRRAADAGWPPVIGLLVLVPILNYGVMLALCWPPTRVAATDPPPFLSRRAGLGPDFLLALALSGLVTAGMITVSVYLQGVYGWALFAGTPLAVGVVSGFVTNRRTVRPLADTLVYAIGVIVLIGLAMLLFALEGVLCLSAVSLPALPLAMVGSVLGRMIALIPGRPASASTAALVLLVLPGTSVAESFQQAPVYEVISTIEIDASPERVWHHIVSFSELPEPSLWLFRLGIAYPKRARIEGRGVGAVRYCEFSTGPFVEPITTWDEPRRLAFDVADQPWPMDELSFYDDVHPPHFEGQFRALRGEFRLVPTADGRTRLEGSTWYALSLRPQFYWKTISDTILHRIHDRVFRHIRELAEADIMEES